jgi:peroxiredoxin
MLALFSSSSRSRSAGRSLLPLLVALTCAVASGPANALDEGQPAPEIKLNDLSGKPVALSSFKGKVVLVDFFASWCAPCRQELPVLEKLSKAHRDEGLVILGVNIDNDLATAGKFLKEVPVSFPVVHDAEKKVAKLYAPPTMPSSYIIDRQGKIHRVHKGFRASDAQKIEAELKALLNADSSCCR